MPDQLQPTADPTPQPDSRLLTLTPELRFIIWRFCLPNGERLILDPEALYDEPNPFMNEPYQYGALPNMFLACKQIYNEASPLLYSQNTLAVVDPYLNFLCLEELRTATQQKIINVELNVPGTFLTIAFMWGVLDTDCPNLTNLKLTFYHSSDWLTEAAKLMYHTWVIEEPVLRLELHVSEWANVNGKLTDRHVIENEMHEAMNHGKMFRMEVPSQIKTINVATSVARGTAAEFDAFENELFDWAFKRDGVVKSTLQCQRFIWGPTEQSESLMQKCGLPEDEKRESSIQQELNDGVADKADDGLEQK